MKVPEDLLNLTDKELSEKCDSFVPAGTYKDDKGNPTCLAHLAEARVFDCWVWLGRGHVKGDNPINKCRDWNLKEEKK